MPITVRQSLAGLVGQLAVQAGQVRGRQLQMARDFQLTSLMRAAQERGADVAARRVERERDRVFAIQRAGAAQIARQRPVEPDILAQRQRLKQFVSEAEAAEIYEPAQLKQAQIFANLGDTRMVQSILGKLPQPTARRRELEEQLTAVTEIGRRETSELQKQLDIVTSKLDKQFTPATQRLLRERPEYMETVSPDVQESLALQQQLGGQIAAIRGRTATMGQRLELGLSIPEQMAFETRQEAQLARQEDIEHKRILQQAREAGELTEREELAIDVMRDRERDIRTAINKEISRLAATLAPFEDEADDPDKHAERIKPVQEQIRQLELERVKSFASEKRQVEEYLRRDKKAMTPIVTDATGTRWRFTGRYRNGKPLYEEIE